MWKNIKKPLMGKKSLQPLFRRLFDFSIEGLNIGVGGRSPAENGEVYAIRYALRNALDPIIFDVGAHGGEYTEAVLGAHSKSRVYAFEPNTRDREALEMQFRDRDEVHIVASALGAQEGEGTLYYTRDVQGLSTLYKRDVRFNVSQPVQIETIDNFCAQNNIRRIDLLKLDTEGHELSCLKGSRGMLPHIRYIQFEMSVGSRDARIYFKDIFDLLSGYTVYRILRDGLIEIKEPGKIEELLFTTNYLAERSRNSV